MPRSPTPITRENLRLPQDLSAAMAVKRALVTVPVRRPSREWFVRVHPDSIYHLHTAVIELKEVGETYLVAQHLWPALASESDLHRENVLSGGEPPIYCVLLAAPAPRPDGRIDTWCRSALEAPEMAMHTMGARHP